MDDLWEQGIRSESDPGDSDSSLDEGTNLDDSDSRGE